VRFSRDHKRAERESYAEALEARDRADGIGMKPVLQ
jgi:hypothetical protein